MDEATTDTVIYRYWDMTLALDISADFCCRLPDESVRCVPGIGDVHGQKLENKGYKNVHDLLTMFLSPEINRDETKFKVWLESILPPTIHQHDLNKCASAVNDWVQNVLDVKLFATTLTDQKGSAKTKSLRTTALHDQTALKSDSEFSHSVSQEGQADTQATNQVAEDLKPPHSPKTDISGKSLQNVRDTPPSISSTKQIGRDGGRITVGGCFIEFQPDTFEVPTDVSVTGTIDSSLWPDHSDIVTPTLCVSLGKISKPATVRLSTWVLPPDDGQVPEIQVLRFSDNKYEVIHTCLLGLNRYIDFECDSFSRFAAFVTWLFSLSVVCRPTLFICERTFITVLHVHDDITLNWLKHEIKKLFNGIDQTKPYTPCSLKMNSRVNICLECIHPKGGAYFDPEKPFNVEIDHLLLSKVIKRRDWLILSKLPQQTLGIRFTVCDAAGNGDLLQSDALEYQWKPPNDRSNTDSDGKTIKDIDDHRTPVTRNAIDGNYEEESHDQLTIASNTNGRVIGTQVGKNGKAIVRRSGGIAIEGDVDPELVKQAIKASTGERVKLGVMFSDYSLKFEEMYRLDQTIYDVIVDIRTTKNVDVTEIMHSEKKETIPETTDIKTLMTDGSIKFLKAAVHKETRKAPG